MIDKLLFDIDGVIFSEERYFDASALTVWEMLFSSNYLALDPARFSTQLTNENIKAIRAEVFNDDKNLEAMKSAGINANWNMVYIIFSHQLIRLAAQLPSEKRDTVQRFFSKEIDRAALQKFGEQLESPMTELDFASFADDFKSFSHHPLNSLNQWAETKLGIRTNIFSRTSNLWVTGYHAFQEWYVGSGRVRESSGSAALETEKPGLMYDEKTVVPVSCLINTFENLKTLGMTLGIGTGRPELETLEPLARLDVLTYVDPTHIVTASDVLAAEEQFPEAVPLAKPHPFTYLYGHFGKNHPTSEIIKLSPPISGANTMIIGDSLADLIAAKKMGAVFTAVLTGLTGPAARTSFEEHGADFILPDITHLPQLLKNIL